MNILDNILLEDGLREIRRLLPPGWSVSARPTARSSSTADATLAGPDQSMGQLRLAARASIEPRDVAALADDARASAAPTAIVSRYLSAATRSRLRERGLGFLDLTGNVRLVLSSPALWIETQGADKDPNRQERAARSLRGAQAGRLVRALVDTAKPLGVRELAAATSIDPGYVSRVLSFLDAEALVTRGARGRLDTVDWPALLRRWATDAPLASRGRVTTWLDPRGLSALTKRLSTTEAAYAITASVAASRLAPVAPPRLATLWTRDAEATAAALGLRPADAGANVMLVEAPDDFPFVGATEIDGLRYAAPSQVVVDLLGSPGRGPAEAEALITWMREHEEVWRG